MTKKSSGRLLLAALALVCSYTLVAQKKAKKDEDASARSVQGQVVDADDSPVVGAVVQIEDMRTLEIRSFITQEEGKYHFSGLKADVDYKVKAQFNGMSSATKTVSIFDTRKVAVYNLKLEKLEKK
jgi:hypothetical protein